jgi:hypothetical protein
MTTPTDHRPTIELVGAYHTDAEANQSLQTYAHHLKIARGNYSQFIHTGSNQTVVLSWFYDVASNTTKHKREVFYKGKVPSGIEGDERYIVAKTTIIEVPSIPFQQDVTFESWFPESRTAIGEAVELAFVRAQRAGQDELYADYLEGLLAFRCRRDVSNTIDIDSDEWVVVLKTYLREKPWVQMYRRTLLLVRSGKKQF